MPTSEEYELRKATERQERNAAWHRLVAGWSGGLSPKPITLTNFARLAAQCQDAWREVHAAQTMRDTRVLAHLNSLHEGSDV